MINQVSVTIKNLAWMRWVQGGAALGSLLALTSYVAQDRIRNHMTLQHQEQQQAMQNLNQRSSQLLARTHPSPKETKEVNIINFNDLAEELENIHLQDSSLIYKIHHCAHRLKKPTAIAKSHQIAEEIEKLALENASIGKPLQNTAKEIRKRVSIGVAFEAIVADLNSAAKDIIPEELPQTKQFESKKSIPEAKEEGWIPWIMRKYPYIATKATGFAAQTAEFFKFDFVALLTNEPQLINPFLQKIIKEENLGKKSSLKDVESHFYEHKDRFTHKNEMLLAQAKVMQTALLEVGKLIPMLAQIAGEHADKPILTKVLQQLADLLAPKGTPQPNDFATFVPLAAEALRLVQASHIQDFADTLPANALPTLIAGIGIAACSFTPKTMTPHNKKVENDAIKREQFYKVFKNTWTLGTLTATKTIGKISSSQQERCAKVLNKAKKPILNALLDLAQVNGLFLSLQTRNQEKTSTENQEKTSSPKDQIMQKAMLKGAQSAATQHTSRLAEEFLNGFLSKLHNNLNKESQELYKKLKFNILEINERRAIANQYLKIKLQLAAFHLIPPLMPQLHALLEHPQTKKAMRFGLSQAINHPNDELSHQHFTNILLTFA